MVNRKRDPWWNKKTQAAAPITLSRRNRISKSQIRLSTNSTVESHSLTSPVLEQVASNGSVIIQRTNSTNTYQQEINSGSNAKPVDNSTKHVNRCAFEIVSEKTCAQPTSDAESGDVTPTRDEIPIWQCKKAKGSDGNDNDLYDPSYPNTSIRPVGLPISNRTNGKCTNGDNERFLGNINNHSNQTGSDTSAVPMDLELSPMSVVSHVIECCGGAAVSAVNSSANVNKEGISKHEISVKTSRSSTHKAESGKLLERSLSKNSIKSTDSKANDEKILKRKSSSGSVFNRSTDKSTDADKKERTVSAKSYSVASIIVKSSGGTNRHSADSNRSSNKSSGDRRERNRSVESTSSSSRTTIRERSPSVKSSDSKNSYSRRSQSRGRSRSRSRERKRSDSPRKPRKLNVAYDKLRAKYGKALPKRTYNPLYHPPPWLPPRLRVDQKGNKMFGEKTPLRRKNDVKSSSEGSLNNSKEKHSSHSSHKTNHSSKPSKSSNTLNGSATGKNGHTSSTCRDESSDTLSSSGVKSSSSSHTSNRSPSTSTRDKSFGHNTSRFNRSKTAYSTHKRVATKQPRVDVDVSGNGRMKMNAGDGVGLQKIRARQKKTFLSTCVEEYYFKRDGSLAEGLKPVMAFKVGNPQFVSEFYEKKTELNDLPLRDHVNTVKLLKEKFVFKVKIGIEQLDQFITDGITVAGQNSFFSQYRQSKFGNGSARNAVLLYRYADVCLGWTKSKAIQKETPLFLLIHKVVYGRTKTFRSLSEAQFIRPNYQCDCLKSVMNREAPDDRSLPSSKVVIADFDKNCGFRQRPRQILPYAFVLYVKDGLSADEEADTKQTVLEWKKRFEEERWKDQAVRDMLHRQKQIAIQQQAAAQIARRSRFLPLHIPPPEAQPDGLQQWRGIPPRVPPFIDPLAQQAHVHNNFEPPPVKGSPHSSTLTMHSIKHSLSSTNMEPGDTLGPPLKRLRQDPPYQQEIDRLAFEVVASRMPVPALGGMDPALNSVVTPTAAPKIVQTKDIGIQVKTHPTIISLQKKSVSLSASTQTLDLETDDSYEAMLLRGGPLIPPSTVLCTKCKDVIKDGTEQNDTDGGNVVKVKLFVNRKGRSRQFSSLSSRFSAANDEERVDILVDEDEVANEPRKSLKSKTAHVKPTVRGDDHVLETPPPAAKGPKLTADTLKLLCYPDRPYADPK